MSILITITSDLDFQTQHSARVIDFNILTAKMMCQAEDREFLLRVSYMEIYNEEINDLLAPENRKLQVHENLEVCMPFPPPFFSTFLLCKSLISI